MNRRLLPSLLLLAALLAGPASARVFESLGRGPFLREGALPGWSRAYSADWTLNGAPAGVEVWSASESLDAALARLRAEAARQGAVAVFLPGSEMAWGALAAGGRLTRFLCTTSESGRQTVVFLFSQTESDFLRSREDGAAARLPDGLTPPPGARPVFTAANRDSGTAFAVYASPGSAQEARAYMAASLSGAGWAPAAGRAEGSTGGGLDLYLRGNALCGFSAKMSGHDGSCVVTVIHRRLPGEE
jgi:hypothetical protein